MGQHQKHVKNPETDRGHGEEIDGDQLLGVILQECAPGLRGTESELPVQGWLMAPLLQLKRHRDGISTTPSQYIHLLESYLGKFSTSRFYQFSIARFLYTLPSW